MQTILFSPLKREFDFAGRQWPAWIARLPNGSLAKRLAERAKVCCGEYYHAPKPGNDGKAFYLSSDGMPSLRWQYADDISGASVKHCGWFTNEFCDETIRGIVFRLPHSRGFLAGWTMGEGMISEVSYTVWDNERDAAHDSDRMAELAAERQREFEEEEEEEEEEED